MPAPRTLVLFALLAVLAAVPPLAAAFNEPFYLDLFRRIMIFSIAALSLNLILGYGGMVSFGHAAYLGIGAYSVGILAFYDITSGWLQWPLAIGASALVGWLLARYVVRKWIERPARRSKTFKAIDHAVAKEPRKMVALFLMAPVIPCGLKSYFFGLTRVRLDDYMGASLVGVLPDLGVKVYLGAAGRDVVARGGALDWGLFALGIVALAALTWLVGQRVRAKLAL